MEEPAAGASSDALPSWAGPVAPGAAEDALEALLGVDAPGRESERGVRSGEAATAQVLRQDLGCG